MGAGARQAVVSMLRMASGQVIELEPGKDRDNPVITFENFWNWFQDYFETHDVLRMSLRTDCGVCPCRREVGISESNGRAA